MVLLEALLLASAASALGCLAGARFAALLRDFMVDKDIAPAWYEIDVVWPPLVIAFAAGLLSAMLGTAAVSWKAGRVKPAEALREATGRRRVLTPSAWCSASPCWASACRRASRRWTTRSPR
ncbi:FtsX-like permease family protein [Streptomyces nogalater]